MKLKTNPIIQVKNLNKCFKMHKSFFSKKQHFINAVNNISFSIERAERVGFVGPNGAGKSTTIKMLTGLLKPSDGDVLVANQKPYNRKNDFLKYIGVIFGNVSSLWQDLTVEKNFELMKIVYDIPDNEFKIGKNNLIDNLGLKNQLSQTVKTLSLGQRIKCEIAACLLHKPKILFLDEPTIGLDFYSKSLIRGMISEYSKKHDCTVLLTSHDLSDIECVCDRLIVALFGLQTALQ